MPAPNPQDAFLLDLSLAYAGGRTVLEALEQAVEEIADVRARALLAQRAEEARAELQGVERIFSLLAAVPQELSCPATDSVRQELDHFKQQDPAPQLLTAMTLLAGLKIVHDEVATYGLLVDKAVLLGQLEAARILTIIATQRDRTAVEIARLVHELMIEMAGNTWAATGGAAVDGRAVAPHATRRSGRGPLTRGARPTVGAAQPTSQQRTAHGGGPLRSRGRA